MGATATTLSLTLSAFMRLLRYIFARLYGYTLGRSFRNGPTEACQDAITQFMIIVGVPALLVVAAVVESLFPQLLKSKDWVPWVTIPAAVLFYVGSRSLNRYARTPEIADRFRSPRSRRITMAVYLATLALSPLVAAVALRVLRSL